MREFVSEYIAYSTRGYYVIDDQTALNHLILSYIARGVNASNAVTALDEFERGKPCNMYIPEKNYLDFRSNNIEIYHRQHKRLGRCFWNLYKK